MISTKRKPLTASQITESAIKELSYRGCEVWRQNQVAVPGRRFIGKKGLADIIGFNRTTGVFVMCEVKTKTDRFSQDQITLLLKVKKANGIALVATENEKGNVVIIDFQID
jgi:hypothetical protein